MLIGRACVWSRLMECVWESRVSQDLPHVHLLIRLLSALAPHTATQRHSRSCHEESSSLWHVAAVVLTLAFLQGGWVVAKLCFAL